ncbi:4971_t:CDS:2 [Funneliformis geosporum]|uniref:4971_t:CDS:1 n=1 Tax=Funneliformis geosporum TaxID=1117311 RepID=A0A9W4SJY7_9GLOM|nr:4971_t:CDS:2 [Funneliformis geosporum]
MPKFIGDELEIRIDLELEGEQQVHVLVFHDETTFQSNDKQKSGWRPKNEQLLQKKNKEEVDDKISNETCFMINPEKNFDRWWNIDQLIDQLYQILKKYIQA